MLLAQAVAYLLLAAVVIDVNRELGATAAAAGSPPRARRR